MHYKIISVLRGVTHLILFMLMFVLVASMFLGTLDLFIQFYEAVVSKDPHPFVIKVQDLYGFFSIILIVIVGYELFRSMTIILEQRKIPVKEIMEIAMIALANKVVTLDLHATDMQSMIGLGVIIVSLGVAYFTFSRFQTAGDQKTADK